MATLKFPESFLWGSATSAYQVEGGIEGCDWAKGFPAGKAADHYHRYEEDFQLARKLNQNAHRLSIEWSRIEPKQGKFDAKEIEHYKNVLQSLKEKNMKTMVTLHHFTTPVWTSWTSKNIVGQFTLHAQRMFKEYGDLVDFWITINEPGNYASGGYLEGVWTPRKKNPFLFLLVVRNMIKAHKAVYALRGSAQVGIAKGYIHEGGYMRNLFLLDRIRQELDFVGLNYYFPLQGKPETDVGWAMDPEGMYYGLKAYQKFGVPIYITENGVADAADRLRKDFIRDHLKWTHTAIEEGADCRGYFHWSLLDNFEWEKGFTPRFGLVEVDYGTLERKPRPSAEYYAHICKTNQLEI